MTVAQLHLVSTVFMAGLIAFVQIVHYPLMARVGRASFQAYEEGHTRRTGWVVVPPMVVELASATWIFFQAVEPADRSLAVTGLVLLGVVWLSTALLQAPAHARLMQGFDPVVHHRLVATNWIRTAAWLARVPVALLLA